MAIQILIGMVTVIKETFQLSQIFSLISLSWVNRLFRGRFDKFVFMITATPFVEKKIFPNQVQDSNLNFNHHLTDFSFDYLFETITLRSKITSRCYFFCYPSELT